MTDIKLTWKEFDYAIEQIAWQLTAGDLLDKITGIYGVPRGGLVPAVALSHRLNKRLLLDPDSPTLGAGSVLIVDDISDTGKTFAHMRPKLSAAIHYNPKSLYRPTAWVFTKDNGDWIVYPWEKGAP